MTRTPTKEIYEELQVAFEHFNATLFAPLFQQTLPPVLITLTRKSNTLGYCSMNQYVSTEGGSQVHEICLNPSYFGIRSIMETLSTLVHEMVHQWQYDFGEPGRKGYHNREWADKMKLVGLYPSSTSKPGGDEVGESMSHFIIAKGPFHRACEALLEEDFTLSWMDRFPCEGPRGAMVLYPDPAVLLEREEEVREARRAQGLSDEDIAAPVDITEVNMGHAPDGSVVLTMKVLDEDEILDRKERGPLTREDLEDADAADIEEMLLERGMGSVRVLDLDLLRATTGTEPHPDLVIPLPRKEREKKDASNRIKYRCTDCDTQIWGRPNLSVSCTDRQHPDKASPMVAVDTDAERERRLKEKAAREAEKDAEKAEKAAARKAAAEARKQEKERAKADSKLAKALEDIGMDDSEQDGTATDTGMPEPELAATPTDNEPETETETETESEAE